MVTQRGTKNKKTELSLPEMDLTLGSVEEAINLQLAEEGRRRKPVRPLEAPVPAQPHSPIYRMHRYYARRPHSVFAKLVKHYSDPGDIVLDPFCGGGVTVVEALRLRRKIVGVDLNPLATWICKVEVETIDLDKLAIQWQVWFTLIDNLIGPMFVANCEKCRRTSNAEWFEWSNTIVCSNCSEHVVLARSKKIGRGKFQCTNKNCRSPLEPSKCKLEDDQLIAVSYNCERCDIHAKKDVSADDRELYRGIAKRENTIIKKHSLQIPDDPFPDMDRARDDNVFGKGMHKFKDFMTSRQRIAMAMAKKHIPVLDKEKEIETTLWHIFSSSLRFTNKFVFQTENWQAGKPVEWAGHNYWLPFNYIELNPIPILNKRYRAIVAGKTDQKKTIGSFAKFPISKSPWKEMQNGSTCLLLTQSSHRIDIPNESIDTIITDPPFGGNVQYGELSDFYLCWIKEHLRIKTLPDKTEEAIETRHHGFEGAKDRDFYEDMLYKVFCECRRVIKPTGWLVMTFHNRDIGVWMSLHRAALRAGFQLPIESESPNRGMIYQPPVSHYTNTIHQRAAGSMLGDFILSFKPVDPARRLATKRTELTTAEEKSIQAKASEIIEYHGGADETTLMTGLIPYLHEQSLLHRLARYDLRSLLESGQFEYLKSDKKWYLKEMISEGGSVKVMDVIKAEEFVQELIYSHLKKSIHSTMDEILGVIYSNLVNSHRPRLETIEKVLLKFCDRKPTKGSKRESFVLKSGIKVPAEIRRIKEEQISISFSSSQAFGHNDFIYKIGEAALEQGLQVHVGKTEQRKEPTLAAISHGLTGYEFGLPPSVFRYIREIDILIFKDSTILGAVEVAFSIGTFNKAVNDRFRNLLTAAPNLLLSLNVVVRNEDLQKAKTELRAPANVSIGLTKRVRLHIDSGFNFKEFIGSLRSGQ